MTPHKIVNAQIAAERQHPQASTNAFVAPADADAEEPKAKPAKKKA
jgi:hypothetical protein